jgi:hypothetical protein
MFEKLTAHAERRTRDRIDARAREIAARLAAEAPAGLAVEAGPDGIRLSGRGLARRLALDPALRRLTVARRLALDPALRRLTVEARR